MHAHIPASVQKGGAVVLFLLERIKGSNLKLISVGDVASILYIPSFGSNSFHIHKSKPWAPRKCRHQNLNNELRSIDSVATFNMNSKFTEVFLFAKQIKV